MQIGFKRFIIRLVNVQYISQVYIYKKERGGNLTRDNKKKTPELNSYVPVKVAHNTSKPIIHTKSWHRKTIGVFIHQLIQLTTVQKH